MASGHLVHLSEEGEGLDAPKRYLIDVNETYVWVEFMIWPPKALIDTEVSILPANNETTEITDAWIEVVYPTEKDTVRMRTNFEDRNNHSIWNGQVSFPFSGNQTIEVWLEVDGDYPTAAKEMLDSRWATQVKGRAVKLSNAMHNGEF